MEFEVGTYLAQSDPVRAILSKLTLHEDSGMSISIRNIENQRWPDVPIIMVKNRGEIIGWCLLNEIPRFWMNFNTKKPEFQMFIAVDQRRRGYGTALLAKAAEVWGNFCVCPWDEGSEAFFRKVKP